MNNIGVNYWLIAGASYSTLSGNLVKKKPIDFNFYELDTAEGICCLISCMEIDVASIKEFLLTTNRQIDDHLLIHISSSNTAFFFYLLLKKKYILDTIDMLESELTERLNYVSIKWSLGVGNVYSKYTEFEKRMLHSPFPELIVKVYFYELLHQLFTELSIKDAYSSLRKNKYISNDIERIKEVGKRAISDINLQKSVPSIREMALLAGVNTSKFKLLFKEIFGESPHKYILEKKLAYANELLASGDFTLTQVAYKIGYNHTSGFTRMYYKYFGKLPLGTTVEDDVIN